MGTVTQISELQGAGGQRWDADSYNRNARFVSELSEGVLKLLNAKTGERILDLGCGDGVLTQKIIDSGARVLGVDASASFVETARASGVNARLIDGHKLEFDREFDAVFSNAALHWMLQPQEVIAGVARALKPGGRFVGEFGGFGNVAAICAAMGAVGEAMGGDPSLVAPWFFPGIDQYADMLTKGGFKVQSLVSFYRPTPLPTEIRGWLETMRAPFFEQFGAEIETAYDRVIGALRPSLCDENGIWYANYVRLRFSANLAG